MRVWPFKPSQCPCCPFCLPQIWQLPRRHGGGGGQQEEQLVLAAEAVVVSLDENYKPKRITAELRDRLLHGALSEGPLIPMEELM